MFLSETSPFPNASVLFVVTRLYLQGRCFYVSTEEMWIVGRSTKIPTFYFVLIISGTDISRLFTFQSSFVVKKRSTGQNMEKGNRQLRGGKLIKTQTKVRRVVND